MNACAIVGDAFAKPMLRALQEHRGRWDLSKFLLLVSSGVMWSPQVKQALLEELPHALLYDSFGSSEAVGFGAELTTKQSTIALGKFRIGPNCKVFTPDGQARSRPAAARPATSRAAGPIPLGYYKDEKKSAETFKTYQGRRWSIPGDWCTVNADGTIVLLGRGSVVHQHRRREGLPRRSRGGAEDAPRRRRRARRRRARREVGRVGDRRRAARAGRARRRGRAARPRARAPRRLQDAEARSSFTERSCARRTARPTTRARRRRRTRR